MREIEIGTLVRDCTGDLSLDIGNRWSYELPKSIWNSIIKLLEKPSESDQYLPPEDLDARVKLERKAINTIKKGLEWMDELEKDRIVMESEE